MTKQAWLQKSSLAVILSTSLLMLAEGGQASAAQTGEAASANTQEVVALAKSLVGQDYQSGANGPTQFDSAGLPAYIYRQVGIDVADSISALYKAGVKVDAASIQPGDLVFFSTKGTSTPNYMGVYVGAQQFVYASAGEDEVVTKSLTGSQASKLIGVRRLLNDTVQTPDKPEPSQPVISKPVTPAQPQPAPTAPSNETTANQDIAEKVIAAGMKYLGTPYEYASTRSNSKTMDCSEFTMLAYKEGAGINIGSNSRSQAEFVKKSGTPVYNVDDLQRGDLIFMMSYKGSKASSYSGIDKASQRITHVGIYLGDGKILHTYSKEAGGVKITQFNDTSWEYRFVVGGRPY
ncbi:C40 family peptidase [Brevibacillus fulvus]|uniref:Cell wall-associated NlpC family hydrolase n=1 Tax=Brevibacillus fulvus TaxID=1125967 RepID=A0A938XXG1_9BACL|nr:NlpC/P60 family protein [Brevibacillus fulvus]MBM7589944.1 cell wall-associated NlpC family hydrolase [Brevibacillus fulvus]